MGAVVFVLGMLATANAPPKRVLLVHSLGLPQWEEYAKDFREELGRLIAAVKARDRFDAIDLGKRREGPVRAITERTLVFWPTRAMHGEVATKGPFSHEEGNGIGPQEP
jgi:hypothetical protein